MFVRVLGQVKEAWQEGQTGYGPRHHVYPGSGLCQTNGYNVCAEESHYVGKNVETLVKLLFRAHEAIIEGTDCLAEAHNQDPNIVHLLPITVIGLASTAKEVEKRR